MNYNTNRDSNYLMTSGEMKVGFNMPEALSDNSNGNGLPPYAKRSSYLVDEYPGCPQDWPRSEGSQISYFVPVQKGKGMWLDFNECMKGVYDVAIVISIQGINAITGLPTEDTALEQYKEECPKHKVKFGPHRFCEQCGHRWPKQNYLSTTATPDGHLWLDGFRSGDGKVRQYILTEERLRGVANAIVGERRVHSIGISFFLSKNQSGRNVYRGNLRSSVMGGFNHSTSKRNLIMGLGTGVIDGQPNFFNPVHTPINWGNPPVTSASFTGTSGMTGTSEIYHLKACNSGPVSAHAAGSSTNLDCARGIKKSYEPVCTMDCMTVSSEAEVKSEPNIKAETPNPAVKLEVGAGAVINQRIYDDPNDLDFWRDKPDTVMIINYANEEIVTDILSKGKKDVTGSEEGFLENIPKGNKAKENG
jgi:hypothetical protein